jgi:hypothetical protein
MIDHDRIANRTPVSRSPVLWALMITGFAGALVLGWVLNIRFDEAYTLDTTANGPIYAFRRAISFEQQAPLYFVLVSLWRALDSSIFFARLSSIIFYPLFIWVAAETAKLYLRSVNPLLIALVVTIHQQVVWNALDIRLYSMMLLISGILMVLFYDAYLDEGRHQRRYRAAFVAVSIIALYTQYYLGFQLAAGAAVLLVLGRRKMLGRYLLDMLVTAAAFVPMFLVLEGQIGVVANQTPVTMTVWDVAVGLYQRAVPLFLPTGWLPENEFRPWIARTAAAVVAALAFYKLRRDRRDEDIALATFVASLGAFYAAAFYLVGGQAFQTRHMASILLPLVLLSFSAVTTLGRRYIFVWLAIVLAFHAGALYSTYRPLAKPGDFKNVAAFIMAHEQPGEPIVVFHADAVLPLRYYYKGQNKLVPLPREGDKNTWNPQDSVLADESQVLDVINNARGTSERIWLVDDGWCAHGELSFNCELLENVVSNYFEVEMTEHFLDPTTVRLLKPRHQPASNGNLH